MSHLAIESLREGVFCFVFLLLIIMVTRTGLKQTEGQEKSHSFLLVIMTAKLAHI